MSMAARYIAPVLGMALPQAAHACTVCHSQSGVLLRAGIFNGRFLQTLGIVALPCLLLALAVAGIYFGMPDLRPALSASRSIKPDASL